MAQNSPESSGDSNATLWYKDGLRFQCQGCGKCCTGEPKCSVVWVTDSEIERIAAWIGCNVKSFMDRYVHMVQGKNSINERPDGSCLMQDQNTKLCRIYEVRPSQCSTFPFWPEILESRSSWEDEGHKCPGIGKGRVIECHEVQKRAWKI